MLAVMSDGTLPQLLYAVDVLVFLLQHSFLCLFIFVSILDVQWFF